ncbi:MAG: uroporphyrin-III methyltransferase [Candidatus Micrarchaeota archaeon]|nr:MAG: uroporphyrin-III methyltransferase [Candidatus Micrarchaeota archaeon]
MYIKLKRVYDDMEASDGIRILVDRLWPRGLRKYTNKIDIWIKDVAPSDDLRKWFAHDPNKWDEFKVRYKEELKSNNALKKLLNIIKENEIVTFLYASSDREHNNAVVLKEYIESILNEERA